MATRRLFTFYVSPFKLPILSTYSSPMCANLVSFCLVWFILSFRWSCFSGSLRIISNFKGLLLYCHSVKQEWACPFHRHIFVILASLKNYTKRRGKADWLSDAAVTAKQTRRQLERRWKQSGSEADRIEYRSACHVANVAINASRSSFYKERLFAAAGDQKALWRISKDLLHIDGRPPDAGTLEAKLLCDGFSVFFADKLKLIASTVCTRLKGWLSTICSRLVESHRQWLMPDR